MGAIPYAKDMDMVNLRDGKRHKERTHLMTWVLRFVLFGLLATIITFLLTVNFGHVDSVGPQQAFETYLLALDEQKWELAETFVVERCQSDNTESEETAGQDLKSRGFSFSSAFVVDEVWLNTDGRTALLGLSTPANLPLPGVASMERVDGDWMIACS